MGIKKLSQKVPEGKVNYLTNILLWVKCVIEEVN